jgi:PTS system N-acetylgalactosamine-specific IIA component
MRTIIIISGHGNYATGLKSSIELIAGYNGDIFYLDLTVADTDKTLQCRMNEIVQGNKDAGVLFICDILGGTPFKVSAQLTCTGENMEVVTGCNIGAILEGVMQKDKLSVRQLADYIVASSKRTTVRFEKNATSKMESAHETEEGI